ncbi:hypothetical protein BGW42_005335 [Actinomortierella wolfii]|nr:hypothetical protein BGW42_005335 [Actinomortierella wolfii]
MEKWAVVLSRLVGEVALGAPPQILSLKFDISSSDMWVIHPDLVCDGASECLCFANHRKLFRSERLPTFQKAPNSNFTVAYGDKAVVSGQLHTDVFEVGNLSIDRQIFGLATHLTEFDIHEQVHGVFGPISGVKSLKSQSILKSEFGLWIGRDGEDAEIVIEGMDLNRVAKMGDAWTYEVTPNSPHWATPVRSISFDGRMDEDPVRFESRKTNGGASVIFDTTTDLLLLPPTLAQKLHQSIYNWFFGWYSGYNYLTRSYTVPCNLDDNADLLVEFGTHTESSMEVAEHGVSANPSFSSSTPANQNDQMPWRAPLPPVDPATLVSEAVVPVLATFGGGVVVKRDHEDESQAVMLQKAATLKSSAPPSPRPALLRISKQDIVREPIPIIGNFLGICYSGIQPNESDNDDWIFGSPWNYNTYMVLDPAGRRMTFFPAV